MQSISTDETKIIYHIDDEETPYLVKLPVPHSSITLSDFKSVLSLPRPNYKYFFKSLDDDFGVVKEEIIDDLTRLPIFKGRVVAWLVTADGSNLSDTNSQCTELSQRSDHIPGIPHERLRLIGDSRPPSFHGVGGGDHCGGDTTTETESMVSSRRGGNQYSSPRHRSYHKSGANHRPPEHMHSNHCRCDTSSVVTSDIETTSFVDSDDDTDEDEINSRISTTTDETSVSRIHDRRHRRRRRRHRMPVMSRTSSVSSITESTMSLNIITVTLNLDTVSFLGISIVGQSNKGGDGGIYVGSIMKGGAVALDGRIEPGDMILQVNDVNFEDMSNDDAVQVLRAAVQKPGPIKLVVAKCWDPNPKGYFTIPRTEPVRPIDPGAWVAHTEAARANQFGEPDYPLRPPSVSTLTSTSSSITSSLPESDRQLIMDSNHLSVEMDMMTIAKSMANADSGLDVRDRMWLKITIPNAFIGSEVVDWLYRNVQGFQDRREARKYANQMLKQGFIKHTVNKSSFSEQCYYVFNESLPEREFANLKVNEDDLPPSYMSSGALIPQYTGNYAPTFMHPWGSGGEIHNYGMFGAQPFGLEANINSNSVHSGNGMDNGIHRRNDVVNLIGERQSASPGASTDFDELSQRSGPIHIGALQQKQMQAMGNPLQQHPMNSKHLNGELMHNNHNINPLMANDGASDQSGAGSTHSGTTATTARDSEKQMDGQSSDIGGSRQSFRMAMGNPCEFFVDVM